MAIIGCGVEGRTGLSAFSKMFPLEEEKIYDAVPEAMRAYRRRRLQRCRLI